MLHCSSINLARYTKEYNFPLGPAPRIRHDIGCVANTINRRRERALPFTTPDQQQMPVGVVIRRSPGVTRWAKWAWRATDVMPGAAPADWKVLLQDGKETLFHAATRTVRLYPSDTEAYAHELQTREPSVYVILRRVDDRPEAPLDVTMVTASPYEAQDYADSGEELVEKVAMPAALLTWITDFVDQHHTEDAFIKRRRDRQQIDGSQDGIGDRRIAQTTDVYRAPTRHEAAE